MLVERDESSRCGLGVSCDENLLILCGVVRILVTKASLVASVVVCVIGNEMFNFLFVGVRMVVVVDESSSTHGGDCDENLLVASVVSNEMLKFFFVNV